jgi:hypothetical protein
MFTLCDIISQIKVMKNMSRQVITISKQLGLLVARGDKDELRSLGFQNPEDLKQI